MKWSITEVYPKPKTPSVQYFWLVWHKRITAVIKEGHKTLSLLIITVFKIVQHISIICSGKINGKWSTTIRTDTGLFVLLLLHVISLHLVFFVFHSSFLVLWSLKKVRKTFAPWLEKISSQVTCWYSALQGRQGEDSRKITWALSVFRRF